MRRILHFVTLLALAGIATAQQFEDADKTLSPYFFVKSDDPNLDQLPLKSTAATVDIAGVIADVKVTQLYKNEGKRPIEAIYTFPASTRAAVYGMKMTIGERAVVAKIGKREEARREYEKAITEGKSASLLEQQRPNVFQMNVGNILPGDEIKVELSYTELLVPTEGVYEFVYPTVVGPRYSNQPEATAPVSEKWVKNPYLHSGKEPSYVFDLTTNLNMGLPIQEVTCTSHKVNVSYSGQSCATVKLDTAEKTGGNRDYVLRFRLAGSQIASGMLMFQDRDENFFLLMLQPPKRVTASQIPPREFIFIVDISGSMHGFPLEISKELLRNLIGNLRPQDKFNVLLFAGSSSALSETESLPATPANLKRAIEVIEKQRGGGGTELLPALKHALALPRAQECARSIVIATDGYVTVETEAFDLIRQRLGEANMFAFGIGSSVNRHLIEGMARAGMGEPFVITKADEAKAEAEKFRRYIESPVLTQIKVEYGDFKTYAIEPPAVPDVLAERPVIVFGKWRGLPQGKITLSGRTGNERYSVNINVSEVKPLVSNAALRYLWARHRIAVLSDYNALKPGVELVSEVTDLGLKYNLLTAYTSFVAVDSKIRRDGGQVTRVEQPLPMPEGVSDLAVGGLQSVAGAGAGAGNAKFYRAVRAPAKVEAQSLATAEAPLKEKDGIARQDKINLEQIVVNGGVSQASVQHVAKKHNSEILSCYQQALQKQPNVQGKLVIKLAIAANGHVTQASFVSNPFSDQTLVACLTQKLKQWRFANARAPGEATITYELAP
jgi:Ca-activated chloride channel family protein